MKHKLLFALLLITSMGLQKLNAQTLFTQAKNTEAEIVLKNGNKLSGVSKRFYYPTNFEKVSPFDFWLRIFKKGYVSPLVTSYLDSPKFVKFKHAGEKKYQKISFDSIETVKIKSTVSTKDSKQISKETVYKAVTAKKLYNIKDSKRDKKKPQKAFLPVVKQSKDISIYGEIYPLRKILLIRGLFLVFELSPPEAFGYHLIENSEKKLIIDTKTIVEEKFLTQKQVEKRAKSKYNRNHSSLDSLFGHCPEAKVLIDKYNVVRNNKAKQRRTLSIAHNKQYRNNEKHFKRMISNNRKNATNDIFIATFYEELAEIMRVYKQNCGEFDDIYNPKSENFHKNIDILNDSLDYNKI